MKIEELTLFTNNLEQQVNFYSAILELPIINSTPESCSFKIGQSTLVFQYKEMLFLIISLLIFPQIKKMKP